ncbi:unnamed protein product [Acanthoscelides obtectus]|uniref:Uncharacterized protein n=1 Tax=Acanthoscelides obtectus TaxID=200917 RepID=A0A9P0JP48_ACAOB|nr:unnamed protein product [Acanthoscelides obtectus]CAK1657964.1 hypothetical protein AOBTE_LOCUS20627 [Acanthoscelides obtectus]
MAFNRITFDLIQIVCRAENFRECMNLRQKQFGEKNCFRFLKSSAWLPPGETIFICVQSIALMHRGNLAMLFVKGLLCPGKSLKCPAFLCNYFFYSLVLLRIFGLFWMQLIWKPQPNVQQQLKNFHGQQLILGR